MFPGANDYAEKYSIGCRLCLNDLSHTTMECTLSVWMCSMQESTQCQQFFILHIPQSKGCIVPSCQIDNIGRLFSEKDNRHSRCPVLKNIFNGPSQIFWSCIMGNPTAVQSHWLMITQSVAFQPNHACDVISTVSFKWKSTERQWFLVLQHA